MQKLLSKYGLAAHLAILAVAPLFLFPFCGAVWTARTLLWLTGLAFVWVLMEPSRRAGEMLHDARTRVLAELVRDPLFWLTVLFAALAAARWANGGIAMAYDSEAAKWYLSEAPCKILPGCAASDAGYLAFAVSLAMVAVIAGCRHALGKSARISFLFTYSFLSACAATVAITAFSMEVPGAVAASQAMLANGTFAGSTFGIATLCGIVVVAGGLECQWNRYFLLFAFAIGANVAGLYFFAPAAVVVCYLGAAVLTLIISGVYITVTTGPSGALKCVAALTLGTGIAALFLMGMATEELNAARMSFFDGEYFPENFVQVRKILSAIAAKAWNAHPWLGTGLGSFGLDVKFELSPADWKLVGAAPVCPPNGWWYLLAERGIVGALMFAFAFAFLAFTFVRRLVLGFKQPFFHPGCWLGPTVLAAVVAETFVDISFLRPEAMLAVGAILALAGSSLPVIRSVTDE